MLSEIKSSLFSGPDREAVKKQETGVLKNIHTESERGKPLGVRNCTASDMGPMPLELRA